MTTPSIIAATLPPMVIATSAGPDAPPSVGAARVPSHATWTIRTGDPLVRRRGHTTTIRFDAPLAPGVTMADAGAGDFPGVRRIVCIAALTEGFGDAGPLGATAAAAMLNRFDWIARFGLDRGMSRLDLFRPADARDFLARLRGGSALALVDLDARLMAQDDRTLSVVLGDGADPLVGADLPALARLLGVTVNSLHDGRRLLAAALAGRLGRPAHHPVGSTGSALPTETARAYLETWGCLWVATRKGLFRRGLAEDPLETVGGIRRKLSRIGTPGGRTVTIEPATLVGLLSAAARTALTDGPDLARAVGRAAHGATEERTAVERALRRLMASAAILLGGLSGRRGGEVASVRRGSAHRTVNGPALSTFIGKAGSVQTLPMTDVLASVLAMLEAVAAASDDGGGWSFRIALPWGRTIELDAGSDLDAFALAEGFGGDRLDAPLASHQLRRGMSLLWEFGYLAGSPAGLAYALRHASIEAGDPYVTEARAGGMTSLRDQLTAATTTALRSIGPEHRARLLHLRRRFHEPDAHGGPPAARERYGPLPLKLLDDWHEGLRRTALPPPPDMRIRIGSQAEVNPGSLLARARAHAATLAATGLAT